MSSVTFSTSVGGDGSTVTDDNNATTGLREGGWKTRFVPCFTQQVAVASFVVTKASDAATSATAATTNGAAQVALATTQANLATTNGAAQVALATTQANLATTNGAAQVALATTQANNAAASYDSFDDRYLGSKASDPTLDNDGNTLLTGAVYWNSTTSSMKVWSGSAWVAFNPAISYLPTVGGTMTGEIVFNAGQAFTGTLPLAGGTMTGAIVFNAGQAFTGTLPLAGGTMTGAIVFNAGQAFTGTLPLAGGTMTGALNLATGVAIASAATVNLNTATGNRVHITGTTTISAVTLTLGSRTVIFDGILTLTHHATNNNLPGAANITTAAGDRAIYESDGITVYCVSYIKASGAAVVNPVATSSTSGLVPIPPNDATKVLSGAMTYITPASSAPESILFYNIGII